MFHVKSHTLQFIDFFLCTSSILAFETRLFMPRLRCAQAKNLGTCTASKGLDVPDLARKKQAPRRRRVVPISND